MTCTIRTVSDDLLNLNPPRGCNTDGPSSEKRVFSCKSKERLGTWNVKSLYQSKLKGVKLEMARVRLDQLGVSELRWK